MLELSKTQKKRKARMPIDPTTRITNQIEVAKERASKALEKIQQAQDKLTLTRRKAADGTSRKRHFAAFTTMQKAFETERLAAG